MPNPNAHPKIQHLEAERGVLGALLLDNGVVDDVLATGIAPDDFSDPRNEIIFQAICDFLDEEKPIEMTLLIAALKAAGQFESIGHTYIASLEQNVLTTGAAPDLATVVVQKSHRRKLLAFAARLQEVAADEQRPVPELATGGIEFFRRVLQRGNPAVIEPLQHITVESLPAFPLDLLPHHMRTFARAVAQDTQNPPCFPAVAAIAALSIALTGRAMLRLRTNHIESANTYILPVAETSERKSAVFTYAIRPLRRFAMEEYQRAQVRIRAAELQRANLEKQHKDALREFAKSGNEQAEAEAQRLAAALDELPNPVPPEYETNDVTPEKLATLIARNSGIVWLVDSEGGVFDTIMGRYDNGAPNLDILLKAYSGERVTIHRQTAERSITIPEPYLSIFITCQPVVLQNLASKGPVEQRGLLGRMLYSFPKPIPVRDSDPPDICITQLHQFDEAVSHLVRTPRTENGRPRLLSITTEARKVFSRFQDELDRRARDPRGDWHPIKSWCGKARGHAARIALILHAAEHHADAAPWYEQPVSADTAARAVAIVRDYFIPHTLYAWQLMGADQPGRAAGPDASTAALQRVIALFRTHQWGSATTRDIQRFGHFRSRAETEQILETLAAKNWLDRIARRSKSGHETVTWRLSAAALAKRLDEDRKAEAAEAADQES